MADNFRTKIKRWYNAVAEDMKDSDEKRNIFLLEWAGSPTCIDCFRLFTEPQSRNELLSKHGYGRARTEVVAAAGSGCSFCQVLSAAFNTPENTPMERKDPGQENGKSTMLILYAVHEKSINNTRRPVASDGDVNFLHVSQCLQNEKVPPRDYRLNLDLKLFIGASDEDPASNEISGRPTVPNRASPALLQKIRLWFDECNAQQQIHAQCPPQDDVALPTRLIDVGLEPWSNVIKLRSSQLAEKGRYSALSYCWGGEKNFTLTKKSLLDLQEGIIITVLPLTLQDAVLVTRTLGLRYLWVDALCIIQDDEHDKAREINYMDKIYMNSSVTIKAASSSKVEEGFLKTEAAQTWSLPFRCRDDGIGSLTIQRTIPYSSSSEPLSQRAWALQEDILSPRILDYETWDIRWRCGGATYPREYTPVYRSSKRYLKLYTRKVALSAELMAMGHSWSQIVADYSRRALTFPKDKLPAIAGIAREAQRKWGLTYVAGMWQEFLLNQLQWRVSHYDQQPPNHSLIRRSPTCHNVPSWSWVSCDCAVTLSFQVDIRAELVSCIVEPLFQSAPMGEVLYGKLTVSAPLLNASSIAVRPGARWRVTNDDEPGELEEPLAQQSHWYMWVSGQYPCGLVLQEVALATYRRIGMFIVNANREGDRIFSVDEWFPKEFADESCKSIFTII